MKRRCAWAGSDPLYTAYHDREWGVPLHDDKRLFEMLTLEGAQAGLAWITILRKRANYRRAFEGFDPRRVAGYDAARIRSLLADPGLVRNRAKIRSSVSNARAFLELQREFSSFDAYLWGGTWSRPATRPARKAGQAPASTPASDALSKDLKRRGFKFVGSTICYAFMQAVGIVNDHHPSCFRHRPLARASARAVHGAAGSPAARAARPGRRRRPRAPVH